MYLLLYHNDDTKLALKLLLPLTGRSQRVTLSQNGKKKVTEQEIEIIVQQAIS